VLLPIIPTLPEHVVGQEGPAWRYYVETCAFAVSRFAHLTASVSRWKSSQASSIARSCATSGGSVRSTVMIGESYSPAMAVASGVPPLAKSGSPDNSVDPFPE
jgi:hypothetical protein